MSIASNLERVRNQVADACARAHREPSSVAVMAVSKVHPAETMLEAYEASHRLFGENRVQEWQSKRLWVAEEVETGHISSPAMQVHLIGPLQNNKTSKAAEIFDAIDTLDSGKTAERLNAAAQIQGKVLPVFIEVKLSHEEAKHGVPPEGLADLLAAVTSMKHLEIRGLMTVPPFDEDPERARPYFQALRELRDQNLIAYPSLTQLSMGMSNDFAVAIEEGSTTIRVGTAIFGKRIHEP